MQTLSGRELGQEGWRRACLALAQSKRERNKASPWEWVGEEQEQGEANELYANEVHIWVVNICI